MQETYIENIIEVIKNKRLLEKSLGVKINNKGRIVFVNGDADKEYLSLEVLEAINLGFSVKRALILKKEGYILQKINIKDITKRKDLERVRARIIGTKGKTLTTLYNLTDCYISIDENNIGIIGDAENIKDAIQAITSIILGSKQGNVYSRIERGKKKRKLYDLGINTKKENEEI